MTPAEARRSLRSISTAARRVPCPGCGARARARCPGSPIGHIHRLNAAFEAQVSGMPTNFLHFCQIFAAAYPTADEGSPEYTADGKIVLWRAAPSVAPYLGRGSYWTHDRCWAATYSRNFALGRVVPHSNEQAAPSPFPYSVYRAEVRISARNARWYELGRADGAITDLNRRILRHPDWPGFTWLLFSKPMEGTLPGTVHQFTQYVHAGKRPVSAARV